MRILTGRRIHTSQIEDDDYFYGFGEKGGEINKAEKYMNMAPGDAMGYNAKETDSLYKHIPFYIKLQRGTKKAVGYFYHSTAECDFNMGRREAELLAPLFFLPCGCRRCGLIPDRGTVDRGGH